MFNVGYSRLFFRQKKKRRTSNIQHSTSNIERSYNPGMKRWWVRLIISYLIAGFAGTFLIHMADHSFDQAVLFLKHDTLRFIITSVLWPSLQAPRDILPPRPLFVALVYFQYLCCGALP